MPAVSGSTQGLVSEGAPPQAIPLAGFSLHIEDDEEVHSDEPAGGIAGAAITRATAATLNGEASPSTRTSGDGVAAAEPGVVPPPPPPLFQAFSGPPAAEPSGFPMGGSPHLPTNWM